MSENNNFEDQDIIELENEDGEIVRLMVERYFYYNGDEYVLLCDTQNGVNAEADRYIMKVVPMEDEDGEEMEEFVPVDDELTEQLIEVISNTYNEE